MAQKSWLEQLLYGGAAGKIKHVKEANPDQVQSDAPGTSSRTDVISPDTPVGHTPSGLGHPDVLGYHQHGTVAAPQAAAETARIIARENAKRPDLAHGGRPGPVIPEYNQFYDHWRTREGWDRFILNTASGSIALGTTGTVAAPIVLDRPAGLRLSEYPGGTMAFPVLLLWTWALSAAATSGEASFAFVPQGGDFQFPLNEANILSTLTYSEHARWVVPAPTTDRGIQNIGTLLITSNTVVGPPSVFWRMGIGWAYVIPEPAFHPSQPLQAGKGLVRID